MSGNKVVKTAAGFMDALKDDHVGAYAAQSAYFIILSIFPFMMILISVIQYTPITQEQIYEIVRLIVPASTDSYVMDIIDELYSRGAVTISLSALAAAWSAGKGFMALSRGMDTIYKIKYRQNYIMLRLQSAFYTVIFILALILTLVVLVFGNSLHNAASAYFPFLTIFTSIIVKMKGLIATAILMVMFLIIYIFVPHRKLKKTRIFTLIPGAALSSVAWYVFSAVFSIYVEYSPGLSNMYGSLTTIIVVMLWLYFCMYILLIGAEINSFFEDQINKYAEKRRLSKEAKAALKEMEKIEEQEAKQAGNTAMEDNYEKSI